MKTRKPLRALLTFPLLFALSTCAAPSSQNPAIPLPKSDITLTPDLHSPGTPISESFLGFSFETRKLLPDNHGRYFFSPENADLVSLFKSLGLKSLRIGGNTADRATVPIPTNKDLDSLYAFAKAADLKIIYNLRLKNTADPADDIRIVKHIMSNYAGLTTCFTLGNEPDFYIKDYADYLAQFKKFSAAILNQVPSAKFCGPSTAGKQEWADALAHDIPNDRLAFLSLHTYPGGDAQAAGDPAHARAHILSPDMQSFYQNFHDNFANDPAVQRLGFRLEECNSLYNGGASHISNSYASAIWALDFMYWWAGHGCTGVNFHTGTNPDITSPVPGGYDAFWTPSTGIKLHPLSYALKTFNIAAHGNILPLTATTTLPDPPNYTAYAVYNKNDRALYLTLMNRNSTPTLNSLSFTINAAPFTHAETLPLLAPNNDAAALENLTLGNAPLHGNGTWSGTWTPLPSSPRPTTFTLTLPATSALILKLTR